MRFRNSIKILLANFGLIYKNLLFRIAVLCISALLVWLAVYSLAADFINQLFGEYLLNCWDSFISLVGGFFSGSQNIAMYGEDLGYNIRALGTFFTENVSGFVLPAIISAVIIFVANFADGLAIFAMGETVCGYMTSLSRIGFIQCFFKKIGEACKYRLMYTLFSFFYSAVLFALTVCLVVYGTAALSFFSLPLALLLLLVGVAFKHALFEKLLPALVSDGKTMKKAVADCFSCGFLPLMKTFGRYFAIAVFLLWLNLSAAMFTFGMALLVTLPMTTLLYVCVQFVDYFETKEKRYYLDFDHIVTPISLRSDEEKWKSLI